MAAPNLPNWTKILESKNVWGTTVYAYYTTTEISPPMPALPQGWWGNLVGPTIGDNPPRRGLMIRNKAPDPVGVPVDSPPVPPPPVPPPVPPPPSTTPQRELKYKKIAQAATAGTGIERFGDGPPIEDLHVEGYVHNLSIQNARSLTLRNVRSIRSYRDDPTDKYGGQGIYTEDIGFTDARDLFLGWNGFSRDNPRPGDFSMYRHGWYIDAKNGKVVCLNPLVPFNAACGIQNRANECEIRGGVLIGNANNIMNAVGRMKLYDTTIYDANYYWDAGGDNGRGAWVGQVGIYAYWPIEMRNVYIVGRVGQAERLPAPGQNGAKRYIPGGIICDPEWKHDDARPSPVPLNKMIDAKDCLISGWPEASNGPGKNGVFRNFDGRGFNVRSKAINFSPMPTLEACIKNDISIVEALRLLTDSIRGLVA